MIILPNADHFTITVKLKSGELFKDKDITNAPMGTYERWVAFWHDGKIRSYPMQEIEYVEMTPQTDC